MKHLINVEMPINKFEISLGKRDVELFYQWNRLLRNNMRDNAFCVVAVDFDAKSRKIRHVALLVDDDAANRRYVQQSIQILKDRQIKIKRKMMELQNNMQIMFNELKRATS